MSKNNKLNAKQTKFCREYLKTGNATQSAIKVGYSEKTAYSIGANLLKKVEIIEYLKESSKTETFDSDKAIEQCLTNLISIANGEMTEPNGKLPKLEVRIKSMEVLLKRFGVVANPEKEKLSLKLMELEVEKKTIEIEKLSSKDDSKEDKLNKLLDIIQDNL